MGMLRGYVLQKALPGLPTDLRKEYERLEQAPGRGKRDRLNAFINTVVPRDAGYGAKAPCVRGSRRWLQPVP